MSNLIDFKYLIFERHEQKIGLIFLIKFIIKIFK